MDGLDSMLENGQWFIQNNPIILKKWHLDENLMKEDVSTVPVWVKIYGVRVTAFSEDGLSSIATKLAEVELKENIVVAIPKITREGHYTCNVHVEYEWKPLRFSSCKVFGHIHEECPKNTGSSEKKTVMKPSQASRGVPVEFSNAFEHLGDKYELRIRRRGNTLQDIWDICGEVSNEKGESWHEGNLKNKREGSVRC
nr:hypothetical protein [Tanacetum cinerariifolium]